MALSLEFEERISNEELFTQYISDIKLEVESIKVKAWKRNDQELLGRLAKIDSALVGIMDTKLNLAEKCQKYELTA
ncbi:MAG: hypothetical protein ACREAE_07270 [Nitrosopumilaceae archaeon]